MLWNAVFKTASEPAENNKEQDDTCILVTQNCGRDTFDFDD